MKEKEASDVKNQLLTVLSMVKQNTVEYEMLLTNYFKVNDIEWASRNVAIMTALKKGTDALNAINKEMPVEEIEKILENSAESIEVL